MVLEIGDMQTSIENVYYVRKRCINTMRLKDLLHLTELGAE